MYLSQAIPENWKITTKFIKGIKKLSNFTTILKDL